MMEESSKKQLADLKSENLQLKQQLEFSKKFMANSNYWETYRDKEGKIIYISPNLENTLGGRKEAYLKGDIQITDFIHEDDIDKTIANYKKVMQGIDVPPHKCRLNSNLSLEYVLIDYKRVLDENGQFNGIRTCISDITELEKKEKNIRNNEELLRNITDNIPALIGQIDNDLKYTYVNKRYADYSGIEVEKIIGSDVNSIISEDTFKVSHPYMLRAQSGESVSFETRYKNSEGEVFYFKSNFVPNIENNQVNGFMVLAWDVTKEKQAELDLKESEEKYRTIIEATEAFIANVNIHGVLTYVNSVSRKIFGLKPEECIGRNAFDFIHPDDKEFTINKFTEWIESDNNNFEFENRQVSVNNKVHYLKWNIRKNRTETGEVNGFSSVAVDITKQKQSESALKESEDQFKGLFEQSHVATAIVGLDTRFIKCNEAFCILIGYNESELIEKNVADITHPEDRNIGMNEVKSIARGEIEYALVRKRYLNKNNDVIWGELTISIVRNEVDKPLYFIVVIQDITKRFKAEKDLKESEAQLKKLNATKDKLFSIIAHDLRSPFNNIIGLSELSMENETDITRHLEFESIINSTAKNTLILLENLLNWSKSQTGKLDNKPKKIVLSSLLNKVKENATAQAVVKNISINILQSEETEVYVDENMVNTIFRNLISNAIKFTNPGGRINVIAIQQKNNVEISVSDNGVGIPKSKLNQLFKISSEAQSLGTANEKGSGLGLILCKEFVEKLGGKIWVESIEGKGSNFKFTIPLFN